ncbi:hypothetical protein GCM10010104_69190 [Streptomyces indiaensis]|uniref:Uncharacterized protein n=1 Tax=Streptomyces indiaensis TaxID=284033 RepID=A0ABN3EL02_9ACTN
MDRHTHRVTPGRLRTASAGPDSRRTGPEGSPSGPRGATSTPPSSAGASAHRSAMRRVCQGGLTTPPKPTPTADTNVAPDTAPDAAPDADGRPRRR